MSDNLQKSGPQDRTRINVHESWELQHWTETLGVSKETLEAAVKAVLQVEYPCDVELVIVDDGSTDERPSTARRATARGSSFCTALFGLHAALERIHQVDDIAGGLRRRLGGRLCGWLRRTRFQYLLNRRRRQGGSLTKQDAGDCTHRGK